MESISYQLVCLFLKCCSYSSNSLLIKKKDHDKTYYNSFFVSLQSSIQSSRNNEIYFLKLFGILFVNGECIREQFTSIYEALIRINQLESPCIASPDCITESIGDRACNNTPDGCIVYSRKSSRAEYIIILLLKLTVKLECQ